MKNKIEIKFPEHITPELTDEERLFWEAEEANAEANDRFEAEEFSKRKLLKNNLRLIRKLEEASSIERRFDFLDNIVLNDSEKIKLSDLKQELHLALDDVNYYLDKVQKYI